ncbi:uncharacterized protein LOC106165587 [Lingula anatina]|uniref:Uncharacterized protein LOC106165587 n=1 Tax=Lingula anatina TaxID=7574 RepID=A0A1S3IM29_LINAN|nr:uncharacterized protein LOC106165587 [Lingula anatina]|eukprot:XP_013399295.2 uncharacterized protein LOC106165587 [Lingula anatina]
MPGICGERRVKLFTCRKVITNINTWTQIKDREHISFNRNPTLCLQYLVATTEEVDSPVAGTRSSLDLELVSWLECPLGHCLEASMHLELD